MSFNLVQINLAFESFSLTSNTITSKAPRRFTVKSSIETMINKLLVEKELSIGVKFTEIEPRLIELIS